MSEEKLLLIPGPSPVLPRILEALARPTVSHVGPEMVQAVCESCGRLKEVVFCAKGEPFIISGAGTLAMEMAVLNTIDPEDRVLIVSQGYFGERMAQICQTFGFRHDVLSAEPEKAVPSEALEARLGERVYQAVVCTHVDTATGVAAPLEAYCRVVGKSPALFIVDGVCATGGMPERMDPWGIDVVFTAAQKCLGVPPGLSILVFSERAMEKRRNLDSIPAYYSDLLRWLPVMHDPAQYFSTPAVNEMRALHEGLRVVMEEGIEQRFKRHERQAAAFRAGLGALNLALFTEPGSRASTLSVVVYPEEIEDQAFRDALKENGVVVAGGLGESKGRVFRIGHMGNLSSAQVEFAMEAIEKTLTTLEYGFEPGSGVAAAMKALAQ